jgi:hypothetical protein
VTRGPFPRFEAMMLDAQRRAPYVAEAFRAVAAELAFRLADGGDTAARDDVINAMAMQCGMVIHVQPAERGRAWTYELTEGPQ